MPFTEDPGYAGQQVPFGDPTQPQLPPEAQAIVDAAGGNPVTGQPEEPVVEGVEGEEEVIPEYSTHQQWLEGIEEDEIRIRKEADHDKAFKLLLEAGIKSKDIAAAESYFKQASGIPPEEEISGTDLIIAVANGIPGAGKDGNVKPLISDKNLEEVIDRINRPTREEGSVELKEANPRPSPGPRASAGERHEDTLEYLTFFKNTFREDDEVLSALTKVLESTRNLTMIEELGLEKYQTRDPGFVQKGVTQLELSPEDIVRALSKPEPEGMGDRFRQPLQEAGRFAEEFAEGSVERAEAEATGFGVGMQRFVEAAKDAAGRARKDAFRERRNRPLDRSGPLLRSVEELEDYVGQGLNPLSGFEEGGLGQTAASRAAGGPERRAPAGMEEGERRVAEAGGYQPPQPPGRLRTSYEDNEGAAPYRGPAVEPGIAKLGPQQEELERERNRPYRDYSGATTTRKFLEGVTDTAVLDSALLNDTLREYRSGRYAMSSDNPLRDPKGTLTPIQEANHSPDLDRTMTDSDLYEDGKIRNPWNQYMNDDIAIGKADAEALATRGLVPGSPMWRRAVADLQWAASQEAKEILFYGADVAKGGDIPQYLIMGDEDTRPARVKYFTDAEKPPVAGPDPGYQRSFFSGSGLLSQALSPLMSGINSYLNEINQTTTKMDEAYGTALDAGKMWTQLSVEDRKQIQFGAYMANKYGDELAFFTKDPSEGPTLNPFEIMDGDVNDAVAFEHWNQLVQEAAMTAARGVPLTPGEITRKAIDDAKGLLESYWGASPTEVAKVINVELTDPNAIIHDARIAGQALMGRNPSEEDYRNLVGLIHSRERDSQIKAARAQAEAESQRKREISAWQRSQFELIDDQFVDPATYTGLDDPVASAHFASIRPTTQGRIDKLKSLEPPGEKGISGTAPPAVGGETINETVGFNPAAEMDRYFRETHGEEIDANNMMEIFQNLNTILRSPIQVD